MSISKFTPFLPDIKIFCINSDSQNSVFRNKYFSPNISYNKYFYHFFIIKRKIENGQEYYGP